MSEEGKEHLYSLQSDYFNGQYIRSTRSSNLQGFFHMCILHIYVRRWTYSISFNYSLEPARPPDLCRVQALPPWGLGGLCGIWRGSDGTPELEEAWRRSREVEHKPHSWRGSGRVWAQAHGLCMGCGLTSRLLKAPHLPLGSYSHPHWHRVSKQKETRDETDKKVNHSMYKCVCVYEQERCC